ncbi:MAG: protease modulator HflC [Gemmatimonadales bacterium]|nr:MAG: protease modulator HflC [Gemmatimonadales bacterium]
MKSILLLGALVAGLVLFSLSTYTVSEWDQVIVTEFGRPVGDARTEAGLHWKKPFIQRVHRLERRYLEWDGEPTRIATRDKRFLLVDGFGRWRIADPLLFYQRVRDERMAQTRIDDIMDGEIRNAVSRHDLIENVRSTNRPPGEIAIDLEVEEAIFDSIQVGRARIAAEITQRANARLLPELGIELLDFRFKRTDYVEEVQQDVFDRMISERYRAAEEFRSMGAGEQARIRGMRERELSRIRSEAFAEAERIRGAADAEATALYSQAHRQDPSFYEFVRSLEAASHVVDGSSTLLMGTDSRLFRTLEGRR